MHQSKNKPNFISRLHSASGLGVRPFENSEIENSKILFPYSCDKSTDKNGIRKCAATRMASSLSTPAVHGYPSIVMRIKTPVTPYPCRCKRAAETAESTPPDSPTKALPFFVFLLFQNICSNLVGQTYCLAVSISFSLSSLHSRDSLAKLLNLSGLSKISPKISLLTIRELLT